MNQLSNATMNNEGACKAVSDKYQFISTMDYLKPFLDKGWNIRKERGGKSTTSKHILHLKHENYKTNQGDYLELVVINSHDRSCAFSVGGGLFRLVCDNGLMVGEDFESFKFRHIGVGIQEKLENSYEQIVAKLDQLRYKFEALSELKYNSDNFSNDILSIAQHLFNKDNKKESKEVLIINNTRHLARIRRDGDKGVDTFTVMNIIQENMTKRSGLSYQLKITDKETDTVRYETKYMNPTDTLAVNKDHKVQTAITKHFLSMVG